MIKTTVMQICGAMLGVLMLVGIGATIETALADQPPGQKGYEGQPGNQGGGSGQPGNGLQGYEGQPGNQGGGN